MIHQVKLHSKKRKISATLEESDGTIYITFDYDEFLKDEIKHGMAAKWSPERKCWHFPKNRHNMFRLKLLLGQNPYLQYDQPLVDYVPVRPGVLRPHQIELVRQGLTYKEMIWAAEMGTGKTLAALELIDSSEAENWWWIGPVPALAAFEQEINKWGCSRYPEVMTYDRMTKVIQNWTPGNPAPQGVIFDESSRLKTNSSQRTQAAKHLVESMRVEWKDKGLPIYVIEMTGTPAPKSPLDWYPQLEIAQPGFIREGNEYKFKERLAIVQQKVNNVTGGTYPEMLGWRTSELQCGACGKPEDDGIHDPMWMDPNYHKFEKGSDEVGKLYGRMKGVVTVIFKRDVLKDLPEKQYRVLQAKPTIEIRNAAKMLEATIHNPAQLLIALRELSDGFLYETQSTGTKRCPVCEGTLISRIPIYSETDDVPGVTEDTPIGYEDIPCYQCGQTGEVPTYSRTVKEVTSAKDQLLLEIFGDHEDDQRLVVYGAFTGTIERLKRLATQAGWFYICADGRPWHTNLTGIKTKSGMLQAFQGEVDENIVFIGQPESAGMGLTLTRSSEIVYYSNTFNGEGRSQSEDRIHRIGMDLNKGALITDLAQLPSDLYIRENLFQKRKLQDITLGDLRSGLEKYKERVS